jgi:hypothetical protein
MMNGMATVIKFMGLGRGSPRFVTTQKAFARIVSRYESTTKLKHESSATEKGTVPPPIVADKAE